MIIEELFSRGVMTMGASRVDPGRQVGVFRPEAISQLGAMRASELEKFHWLAGAWNHENRVPATRYSPAYTDVGSSRFSLCEKGGWICGIEPDGKEVRHITYDPFSRQWIYLLTRGAYAILRSPAGWDGNRIAFSGRMTMLGIDCDWRMTWTKKDDDVFGFVNEELLGDGSWAYVDEWQFTRKE